jgi:hypothetical protein
MNRYPNECTTHLLLHHTDDAVHPLGRIVARATGIIKVD